MSDFYKMADNSALNRAVDKAIVEENDRAIAGLPTIDPWSALMQESNGQMIDAVIGHEHKPFTMEAIAAVEKEFDFSARYTVPHYGDGMAWVAFEFATEQVEIPLYEPDYVCSENGNCDDFTLYGECHHTARITEWFKYETVQDRTRVLCRMVGDNHVWTFDVSDLTVIDGEVCSCGQIGCGW